MILACVPVGVGYPIIVIVRGGDVAGIRGQFRDQVGTPCDGWTFLHISDVLVWDKVVKLLPSDTPRPNQRKRGINPNILNHLLNEDIYAVVDDTSDQEPFMGDNSISCPQSSMYYCEKQL